MVYDLLRQSAPARAIKDYLKILRLAAEEGETVVDETLRELLERERSGGLSMAAIEELVRRPETITPVTEVEVAAVDLTNFDQLCRAMAVQA